MHGTENQNDPFIELDPLSKSPSTPKFKFSIPNEEFFPIDNKRLNDPNALKNLLFQAARDGLEERFIELLQFLDKPDNINWQSYHKRGYTIRQQKSFTPGNTEDLINSFDETRHTILHYAARFNRSGILATLLDRRETLKLKVDCETEEGLTPLHYSARYISNQQAEFDMTTITKAIIQEKTNDAKFCSSQAINLLIHNGACINGKDKYQSTPLHHACTRGNYFGLWTLLNYEHDDEKITTDYVPKVDINAVDNTKQTPLHVACSRSYIDIVNLLINSVDCNLLATDGENSTPFHLAALYSQTKIFQLLMTKTDNDIIQKLRDTTDYDGNTVLHNAVLGESTLCVEMCIKSQFDLSASNNEGAQCIHLASKLGYVKIAAALLESTEQTVRDLDSINNTPLHYAARYDRDNMIEYLLSQKANPNAKNVDSFTPLMVASFYGNSDALAVLLRHKNCQIDSADKYVKTALFYAVEKGEQQVVDMLLKHPEGQKLVNKKAVEDLTPLHVAAKNGFIKIVQHLLRNKADIISQTDEEQTPLHLAAAEGQTEVCRILLEHDPDQTDQLIYDEDEYGNYAIHLACQEGRLEVTRCLIYYEASVNETNTAKFSPIHLAASNGHSEIISLLLDEGALVNGEEKSAIPTPLNFACQKGHIECVQILLAHGADMTLIDKESDGSNALDLAIDNGHEDIVELLISQPNYMEAMDNYTGSDRKPNNPLRKLIRKMPTQAYKLFSKLMPNNLNDKNIDSKHLKVTFKYSLLDDIDSVQKFVLDYEEENKINKPIDNFFVFSRLNKKSHPLAIMVEYERVDLLKHPLVRSMVRRKWQQYTRYFYYLNLSFYILFLVLLTLFVFVVPSCDLEENGNATTGIECPRNFSVQPGWYSDTYGCSEVECNSARVISSRVIASAIIFISIIRLLQEVVQVIFTFRNYISDFDNIIEWFIYLSSIAFVSDIFFQCGYRDLRLWRLGAFAVLAAWINLAAFLRKLPLLGIYVLMLIHVFQTFAKFVLLAIVFLFGFASSFYMVFRQQNHCSQFRNPLSSFLKTVVMMTGEFEFDAIFNEILIPLYNPWSGYFLWLLFIVLVPIILANLLVGLAVDDIKGVQETAALKRLALQVDLVLSFEATFPFSLYQLRHKLILSPWVYFPNQLTPMEKLSRFFGIERTFNMNYIADSIGLRETKLEAINDRTILLDKEFKELRSLVKLMSKREENMEAMLKRMTEELLFKVPDTPMP